MWTRDGAPSLLRHWFRIWAVACLQSSMRLESDGSAACPPETCSPAPSTVLPVAMLTAAQHGSVAGKAPIRNL